MQKTGVIFALIRDKKKRDGDCKNFPFMWCLPGGEREEGENFETALLREIREEYDLDLRFEQCIHFMDYNNGADKVYVCNINTDQEPKLQEGLAMSWRTIEEIEKLQLGFQQEGIIPALKRAMT